MILSAKLEATLPSPPPDWYVLEVQELAVLGWNLELWPRRPNFTPLAAILVLAVKLGTKRWVGSVGSVGSCSESKKNEKDVLQCEKFICPIFKVTKLKKLLPPSAWLLRLSSFQHLPFWQPFQEKLRQDTTSWSGLELQEGIEMTLPMIADCVLCFQANDWCESHAEWILVGHNETWTFRLLDPCL